MPSSDCTYFPHIFFPHSSKVFDWVRSMVAISRFQRIEHRIKSSLGFISPSNSMSVVSRLREENKSLKEQV